MSIGQSRYDGVNIGVRRRMDRHVQLSAWYSLAKATGRGGQAVDELTTNLVQDSTNPFADVQDGPAARTDARHKVTVSAIIQAPWSITVSPIYPLPLGAADPHLVRLRQQPGRREQRHLPDGVSSTPGSATRACRRSRRSARARR